MTTNQKNALELLKNATKGSFDCWDLMGPHNAKIRSLIMTTLQGKKVPQKNCGVIALQAAFYNFAQPQGNCRAAEAENFTNWAITQFPNDPVIKVRQDLLQRMGIRPLISPYQGQ